MKNYKDSDYAANKNASGIVYRFANETVEITLEDYLRENPGKTAAHFAALKALSDSDYLERDRSEYRQTWKNIAIEGMEEVLESPEPTPEDEVIAFLEQGAEQAQKKKTAKQALGKLTDVQRRRYVMHHAEGLTTRQIAAIEGAKQQSVSESILSADKKIKKFLSST